MNINELEELAKAATPGTWTSSSMDESSFGIYDTDGRSVAQAQQRKPSRIDLYQKERAANTEFIAAANPSAIRELIAAYREAVAALCSVIDWDIRREYIVPYSVRDPIHRTLDTAKRLGVE